MISDDCEFKKLQAHRESLPIYPYRDQILRAVQDHQVLVLAADPGSGLSTQIPQYLHEAGYTKEGFIICTQVYDLATKMIATRVAREMGVDLGREVGYVLHDKQCCTEDTLIRYITEYRVFRQKDMDRCSVVILEDSEERTLATDILMGIFKDRLWQVRGLTPFRLIITTASVKDAEKFSEYFYPAPIIRVSGRQFPVEVHHAGAVKTDYLEASITAAIRIHVTEPIGGDILVFLPSGDALENAQEILTEKAAGFKGSGIPEMIICRIEENQQAALFAPTPRGARKIILAGGIAETAITFDGVKYVVDSGFCGMCSYDQTIGQDSVYTGRITKFSADQRAARAGKNGPGGKCLRLYTELNYHNDMEETIVPGSASYNPLCLVLKLKFFRISSILDFDYHAVEAAKASLVSSGLLDNEGKLTAVGSRALDKSDMSFEFGSLSV